MAPSSRNPARCSPLIASTPCSELKEHEKNNIRSSVDSFLRSFPMMGDDGTFRRDATRRDRAEYRLAGIAKQRAQLDFEEQLLRAEIDRAERKAVRA